MSKLHIELQRYNAIINFKNPVKKIILLNHLNDLVVMMFKKIKISIVCKCKKRKRYNFGYYGKVESQS